MAKKKTGLKRKALGRGLEAIIPRGDQSQTAVPLIPVDEIRTNPNQPRKRFDDASLEELAASIREKGIIQPLVVRKVAVGYELIAGERRLRAAKKAGLEKVPAVVKNISETEALELALIENIQREDLSPLEVAEAYSLLVEEFGFSQEEVARRVGKERSTVANYLRILRLPREIKEALQEGVISMGHAKAILSVPTEEGMLKVFRKIVDKSLSVRDAEELARAVTERGAEGEKERKKPQLPVEVKALLSDLQKRFGMRVSLKGTLARGKLEFRYGSQEELDALLERLKKA
ncbi:MAG: ParB/RepB/Spo0J family partition protein [Deltaproteobacteria bacterium]|nr:MAG: ParB/RepB/Spo0J family partition protein [Deltaproteobacteria bacterium]